MLLVAMPGAPSSVLARGLRRLDLIGVHRGRQIGTERDLFSKRISSTTKAVFSFHVGLGARVCWIYTPTNTSHGSGKPPVSKGK